jgi:hypothetical protein
MRKFDKSRFVFVAILCAAILVSLNLGPRGPGALSAATPLPYATSSITPATATSSCGPLYSSPTSTIYCVPIAYATGAPIGCSTSSPQSISIGGGHVVVPVPTGTPTVYAADAGFGTQFLPVTWGGSTGNYLYVASLVASASFTLIVFC